ncbi:hypothetical protein PVAP13_9NG575156 [Panicum virgatum]|uniref:Aminotransferase-like plant mobile domain-containing protein n=1 Tax=Panicum virgatum TaxID=38727 RepID=A0A8T0MWV0_PANVG|nr:hypothetical protein PVAP13_9NG575156 [Panicum virgatum]
MCIRIGIGRFMAKKRKLETVGHPSPPRRNTRAASKSDLGGCGDGGPSQTQRASDAALSPKRVTRASCRDIKGMPDQDVENKRRKKSIIMGDEVKQKSKEKEAMDECHTIKKQPDKDLRKKGSARRLILINNILEDPQKKEIERVGFGGLLLVQCWSVPEKLSSWLIKRFDVTRSELVIPYRGRIKVDDHAAHRILGLPMVGEHIDYAKNSFADTYEEFYKVFNHENDQKAPTFTETENWLLGEGKKRSDTLWLWYCLEFAISSFLCPTSNPSLCVRAFHAIADIEKINKYNWCRLVVEKLIRGITKFNEVGKKSVSGCLFLLTILYLDALDTGDIVDQTAKVKASVWTRSLVTRITTMDKVSSTEFGKLHLKAKYQMNSPNMLIQPEKIDEFVNSNMPAESVTMDRNTFKQAISEFSLAINEAVVNLTFKLSQGGKQPTISTGAPARAQSTRAAAAEKQSSSAATKDEDAEFEDKSDTPSGGVSSTLRSLKTSPLLIVSADPKENKMGERVRKVVVRNWKIMLIQILATIGEKMGRRSGRRAYC